VAERRQFEADLSATGEPGVVQGVEQAEVGVAGGGRPHQIGGVFAEEVDGAGQAVGCELAGDVDGVARRGASDEPADDGTAQGRGLDEAFHVLVP
jgi:hypothetical protein